MESPVKRPDGQAAERGRGEQMDISPSNPLRHELTGLDEVEDLLMIEERRVRQGGQEFQNLSPPLQAPAGELADHEWMRPYLAVPQAVCQESIALAEVINPDRGIDEH